MILITGADGFIGSALVPFVRKKYKGEKIFLTDKSKTDLVKGDFTKLPKKPRIVFHLAAATDTSLTDFSCNDIGTKNLLEAIEPGPDTHIIFTSTQAIFSGRKGVGPISEKTKPAVNNAYGRTKLRAEKILIESSKKKKFKLTIVRLPTVWGPNPRKNSFLNLLKNMVRKNSIISKFDWPGKVGLASREDVCRFLLKVSDCAQKKPKIISICAQNLTLFQIFEILTIEQSKKYKQICLPDFVWSLAINLKPYLKYLEPLMPAQVYNYFWRASIVIDSPLWCKVNLDTKVTKM